MNLWIWTVMVATCVWLYYHFKKSLNYFEEFGIPYLPGWPLLGNCADLFFRRKHISDIIRDIYNISPEAKYVGAFDFTTPIIMLRDPELIKTITIKHFDNFPDHKSLIDHTVDPLFGGNLFNMTGGRWKETRALLSPAFTSSKMKAMYELIVTCVENFVHHIATRSAEDNKMVAMKDLFTKYTNDVIATCAFGISVDSLEDPKNDFYVLGRKATNLEGLLTLKLFLARTFPGFVRLLKVRFVSDDVASFFKNIVSATVSTRDEKKITRPDMLQLMMDARGKESKYLKLDITEMTAQAFIFFFGGFDTTSSQMCLMAHELAVNPDIQRKLQREIDDVLGESKGKPTYEIINAMPYLDAVFNESMRRHTQAGFLDRVCVAPFELPPALPGGKPYTVQPGTNLWIPPSAIHMDTKYYDEPEKFDPERYYQKKVTVNDVTNLGFGIGPRSCIGNRFAVLETKILFFFLLSKFSFKPNEKTCQPLRYSKKAFVVTAEGGYWLAIEPRS